MFGNDLAALNGRQRRAIPDARIFTRLSPRLMDEIALAKLEMVGLRADVRGKYPAELSGA